MNENIMMEWTHCPICRSKNVSFAEGIGECHDCTHKFRQHVPLDLLPKYYEKQYWNNDKNRQGITSVRFSEEWSRWVAARMKILESFHLLGHQEPSQFKILEFGCAEGMLLYALKQQGYSVMGNDVCAVVDESMQELGIEISKKPIEEFVKEDKKFDLIMSFHVVEHLRNPLEIMGHLSNMLTKGGVLLMHVPVDDQEVGNADHFHFFSNKSCIKLMEEYTEDIRSDFVYYPITKGGAALAATYVGRKKDNS